MSKQRNYLADAWLVLLLSLAFGAALAGVHTGLEDRIAQNRLRETLGQIPLLVPGAAAGQQETLEGQRLYRAVDGANRLVGWVLPTGGQGFADRIELLIGLDAAGERLTGLYILDQKETPGLGNRIADKAWRDQFNGQSAGGNLRLVTADPKQEEVQAITGATISSDSVVHIVNTTVKAFRAALAAGGGE